MSNLRRILRARRVINKAADLLESLSKTIQACETIDGYWPAGSEEARLACLEAQAVSLALRVMLQTPADEAPHAA